MQASSEIDMAVAKNSDFDNKKKIEFVENLRRHAIARNWKRVEWFTFGEFVNQEAVEKQGSRETEVETAHGLKGVFIVSKTRVSCAIHMNRCVRQNRIHQ